MRRPKMKPKSPHPLSIVALHRTGLLYRYVNAPSPTNILGQFSKSRAAKRMNGGFHD